MSVIGKYTGSNEHTGSKQLDILLSGVGGQGIQLMAKTLAMAATQAGREVMMSASYGAEIRGGHSDASVSIAESDLNALPILPSASHAIVMNSMSWRAVASRLRVGAVALVNSNALDDDAELPGGRVVRLAADDLAASLGAPGSASFVTLGAFAGLVSVVSAAELQAAMRRLVPPYRSNLIGSNEAAIEAGFAAGRALRAEVIV
jgi:2-oxoglutarate ferredoxin oxidoreductase subunit gamma